MYKIEDLALYIVNRSIDMYNDTNDSKWLVANKKVSNLLFFIQVEFFYNYIDFCIPCEDILKCRSGILVPKANILLKKHFDRVIKDKECVEEWVISDDLIVKKEKKSFDYSIIKEEDRKIIDSILNTFSDFDEWELSDFMDKNILSNVKRGEIIKLYQYHIGKNIYDITKEIRGH